MPVAIDSDLSKGKMAMSRKNEEFPLHKCVFQGDIKALALLIKTCDIAEKDKQGNTPLHLAVMLGRKECIKMLLAHGAPVKAKNLAGWTPLAEAVSYGDRHIISLLLRKLRQQTREQMEKRRPDLVAALHRMGDFYMELKWDFQSWVPFLSKILPSDICRIYKYGSSIRIDTTLVDFNDMRWERGDLTFIFNGDQKPGQSITIMDNKAKKYQRVMENCKETEPCVHIEDEVDRLMSTDIMTGQISTKTITFSRAQTGWFFREDRREMVGPFQADFYQIDGMVLQNKKRREHLSEEDLQTNRSLAECLSKGNGLNDAMVQFPERRASLNPPPESTVTWEEYATAPAGRSPILGRNIVYKEKQQSVTATVAMSPDFPLTVEMLLNVLEAIAPLKHINKLRQFVLMKLPPGFPVKIDIPILPMVTAKVTFQEFVFRDDMDPKLFQVPPDYKEDPMSEVCSSVEVCSVQVRKSEGIGPTNDTVFTEN